MAGPEMLVRLLTALRLWARTIKAEPAAAAAIVAVALLAVVLAAAGSRQLDQVSRVDLRNGLDEGPPEQRSVRYELDSRIGAGGDDPFAQVERQGDDFRENQLPASTKALIDNSQFVIDSSPYRVSSFPDQEDGPFTIRFRFRQQQNLAAHMSLTEGRFPEQQDDIPMLRGPDCPADVWSVDGFDFSPDVNCRLVDIPVFEVVVTADTAEAMMIPVGEKAVMRPDVDDRRWGFTSGVDLDRRIILRISGLIELSDLDDDFWYDDITLHHPRINENPDFRRVLGTGVFDPDDYRRLVRHVQGTDFEYTWRYLIDSERLDRAEAAAVAADLRRVTSREGRVSTVMPRVIEEFLAQRRPDGCADVDGVRRALHRGRHSHFLLSPPWPPVGNEAPFDFYSSVALIVRAFLESASSTAWSSPPWPP